MDIGETVTFRSRDAWRRWLARHYQDKREIWLVYYKKSSGKSGVSYDESVEDALAYGWIDGQTKSIDDVSYAARGDQRPCDRRSGGRGPDFAGRARAGRTRARAPAARDRRLYRSGARRTNRDRLPLLRQAAPRHQGEGRHDSRPDARHRRNRHKGR